MELTVNWILQEKIKEVEDKVTEISKIKNWEEKQTKEGGKR